MNDCIVTDSRCFSTLLFLPLLLFVGGCGGDVDGEEESPDTASGGSGVEATEMGGASSGSDNDLDIDLTQERRICECAESDYFVELKFGEETLRFTEAPPDGTIHNCDIIAAPAAFMVGTCLPNQLAACSTEGDCLEITSRTFVLTDARGEVVLETSVSPTAGSYFQSFPDSLDVFGIPVPGSFVIERDPTFTSGDSKNIAEASKIEGTFVACLAGADLCLR